MNYILIVILGCNILHVLQERIITALNFANLYLHRVQHGVQHEFLNKSKIKWLLSGGKKDSNSINEFEIMKEMLENFGFNDDNFIVDGSSTNTAQNFIFLKSYLESNNSYSPYIFDDIYIVTSNFHYSRANKIIEKIIPKNNFKWILTEVDENIMEINNQELYYIYSHLQYMESLHIKNINSDVQKAFEHHGFTNIIETIHSNEIIKNNDMCNIRINNNYLLIISSILFSVLFLFLIISITLKLIIFFL